jgi:heme exporter protein A
MSYPLSGENLTCIRGDRLVFAGLDFAVARGGALLLTGRNGSGKTSLLRLMAGLTAPTDGVIRHNGEDYRDDPTSYRADIHYVAHYDAIKSALTVCENLTFWTELHGGGDVMEGLAAFDLENLAALPARFLSAGQRRRLALARLITIKASVWLLDEPSVALDSTALDALQGLIAVHRRNGGAVIVSTHAELGLGDAKILDVSVFARQPVAAS